GHPAPARDPLHHLGGLVRAALRRDPCLGAAPRQPRDRPAARLHPAPRQPAL
ncbi:MAG: hypothetical protein AVDCRST_MAG27-2478, partial [uncultured Craurococcus sp.]